VHFPGAVNSRFTTSLKFAQPSQQDAMPTYRVLDQDGVIVDNDKEPPNVSEEEVFKMYKDMLT
ncbi:hypothetical protein LTR16_007169, partial [Cryomyces antarcticus]